MQNSEDHFYSNLPIHKIPLYQLLIQNQLFEKVVASWCVIITDIKRSTAAVNSGLHENVNLIATGSIVAVLNIAFKANISVPFFFGGDGASFIVPPSIVDDVMKSLLKYKDNTLRNFNLDLRTGIVPVEEIYKQGHTLNICRFSSAETFSIPIVLGDGLAYAEQIIKGENYLLTGHDTASNEIDLSGMQCRWDKIEPPESNDEVVTLIVIAPEITQQAAVFSKVIHHLDQIYGTPEKRQPISVSKLIFKTSFNSLGKEMKHRIGKIKLFELIKSWLINIYGYIYFRTERGRKYLKQLVEMSDTLVIDGRINTVITGTAQQRLILEKALDQLEKNNEILYGLYVSDESIMSCYVRDLEDDHIHFVDGADGGYTQAAGILKQKISDKLNAR
ncbi:DUF3095 domain-containing protein [Pedobacter sp. ISL-68]|uniref:DUF3095 domain-containing protein n=1 Tax=unclassified Pedobacter TaxID=2628915 RepID=UPI001BEBA858|nr:MULTISPECIES: DUF3095 domain-containing protein [unclassified Pedobacter]MBT2561628.1 DUF3095 domain-containing protein [Pedobacter sp. ISL-64]MBT2591017.1 DUF3095 domain-containing protein [Pedobacter sp. ISL-68]